MSKAIVSFSGGLDSVLTTLYVLGMREVDSVELVYFYYDSAVFSRDEKALGEDSKVMEYISTVAHLHDIELTTHIEEVNILKKDGVSEVPSRNLIFTSLLLNRAVVSGASIIALGIINSTEEPYGDANEVWVNKVKELAFIQQTPVNIVTPISNLIKNEVIENFISLMGMDNFKQYILSTVNSCNSTTSLHETCGECSGCQLIKSIEKSLNN